jgi:hypothetical protein
MHEAHAPQGNISNWKEILLHIGIITVGLLIALGIDQVAEYFHHRHQLTEAREAIKREREVNKKVFALLTEEQNRIIPLLQDNLAILTYLHRHPGAPESQWPAKFEWGFLSPAFNTAAWDAAKSNNAINYMPQSELELDSQLYKRVDGLTDGMKQLQEIRGKITIYFYQQPDPTKYTPEQIDQFTELTTQTLVEYLRVANSQRNFNRQFPDFTPVPKATRVSDLTGVQLSSKEQQDRIQNEVDRLLKIYELEYKNE